jgi:hypothetical protein
MRTALAIAFLCSSAAAEDYAVWEIHPVYTIDVCKKKSLSSCRNGVDTDWVALDVWLHSDDN